MHRISVIIPVYNVEKYLRECLDSVRTQTFKDFEVICVDDGSTDSSPSILSEYAAKDSRFRIIRRKHTNAGACRNAGLDVADGAYLSFLDSDDVFAPRMLECLLHEAERNKADIVTCSQITFFDGCKVPVLDGLGASKANAYVYDAKQEYIDIYRLWEGRAWDKLFSGVFVREAGLRFQEIRSSNDMRFTYSALALAQTIVRMPNRLIAHRTNPCSLESTRSKGALCIIEAIKSYYLDMVSRGVFVCGEKLEKAFRRWIVECMFWYMDTIDTVDAYEAVYCEFKSLCREFALAEMTRDDFAQDIGFYNRLQLVVNGATAMESLRYNENLLRQRVSCLRSAALVQKSAEYRIGSLLLRVPRLILSWLKGWK